jgi:hypothetical protein
MYLLLHAQDQYEICHIGWQFFKGTVTESYPLQDCCQGFPFKIVAAHLIILPNISEVFGGTNWSDWYSLQFLINQAVFCSFSSSVCW